MKAKHFGLNLALAAIVAMSALGAAASTHASSVSTGKGSVVEAPCGNTLTINPDGDTTLFEGGGGPGGAFTYLKAQNPGLQRRPLLHFNLAALPTSNICDARLSLFMYSAVGAPIENISAHYVMAPWVEAAAVWPGPALGAAMFATPVGAAVGWYNWNLTNAVINWKSGAAVNNGVALVGGPGAVAIRAFYSREFAAIPMRPQLIIHY